MRTTLLLLFALLGLSHTQAQTMIRGQVTDSLTREPLPTATVTLHRGNATAFIDYAITDADGRFAFKREDTGDLYITVTYLGYRKERRAVEGDKVLSVALQPESVTLKEIEIKGGRVSMRQDTIKYDLARFASGKDSNVKEALKKLPGIDVDEHTGQIRYQGKAISHFYVEGMDVTGGSYNQVNENLKADAVESAEIIERHQPIRSLRDKVPTDNVALNLKLKPEARSKWFWNADLGLGYGDEALYNSRLNALQLAKSRQSIYTYKADRSGKDLTTELQRLTTQNDTHRTDEMPVLVAPPGFSLPLEKERLLDNETHLVALNRLHRKDDTRQNRFSLNYLHDEQRREEGSEENYFYGTDTIRTTTREKHRLRTDRLHAAWDYEMNGEQAFTRNVLTVDGEWTEGVSDLSGDYDLTQRIGTDKLEVKNRFSALYNKEKATWGFRSYTHYVYLPSSLKFGEVRQTLDAHQAYTDNQFYYLRKRNGFGIEFTGGMNGRLTFLQQGETFEGHRLQVYAQPCFSLERSRFRVGITPGVEWERHPRQEQGDWHFNPALSVRYQPDQRWTFRAYASLQQRNEQPTAFYPTAYYADYRTLVQRKATIADTQTQAYWLYSEYKRPLNEFFWTLELSHFNQRNEYLTNREYLDDRTFRLTSLKQRNRTESYQAKGTLSKGFYDWNLKTSLEATYYHTKGQQAGQGIVQPYESQQLSLQPKVSWSPTGWLDASYQGNMTLSRTDFANGSGLPALWEIRQRFTLALGDSRLHLNLTAEHYTNDLTADESIRLWLADVSLRYVLGKWCFQTGLHNLFDRQQYRYTTYSDIQSRTSWIEMRPREWTIAMQYKW